MVDWEQAQLILAKAVGGKVTPGSGNGNLKGDVVKPGLIFEVKQTSKKILTIRNFWLRKLLREAKRNQAVFVIFFELRGYAYVHEAVTGHGQDYDWVTKGLKENELPEMLYSGGHHQWVLTPWSELKDL